MREALRPSIFLLFALVEATTVLLDFRCVKCCGLCVCHATWR